jgi:hypothetical protein
MKKCSPVRWWITWTAEAQESSRPRLLRADLLVEFLDDLAQAFSVGRIDWRGVKAELLVEGAGFK